MRQRVHQGLLVLVGRSAVILVFLVLILHRLQENTKEQSAYNLRDGSRECCDHRRLSWALIQKGGDTLTPADVYVHDQAAQSKAKKETCKNSKE